MFHFEYAGFDDVWVGCLYYMFEIGIVDRLVIKEHMYSMHARMHLYTI